MLFKDINFSKYSSFKIGSSFKVAILDSCDDLYTFPSEAWERDSADTSSHASLGNPYLIGSCNNVLIGTQPPPLMMLSKKYDYIKLEDNILKIGGATPSGKIASFCKKNNIANFEFVSHLPGKLGGLVYMNAGLKEYEIFNHLIHITTCSGMKQKQEIEHGYRFTDINEPILEATFELSYGFDTTKVEMFKKMRSNQPSTSSAGSCFKNPEGDYAGRLIEAVGLKGQRVGGMEFSIEHANFLVNHGGGNFDDAIFLIQEAQRKVFQEFDIWLECEVVVLDKRYMGGNSPLIYKSRT